MAKLIYAAVTSLDGYVSDEAGRFEWAEPDADVHAFINDLERPIGTYLYGRRMYRTMAGWETPETIPDRSPAMLKFARIWQAADKIVYSSSSMSVASTTVWFTFSTAPGQALCRLMAVNHGVRRTKETHDVDARWAQRQPTAVYA